MQLDSQVRSKVRGVRYMRFGRVIRVVFRFGQHHGSEVAERNTEPIESVAASQELISEHLIVVRTCLNPAAVLRCTQVEQLRRRARQLLTGRKRCRNRIRDSSAAE